MHTTAHCTYRPLANGLHLFAMQTSKRQAVDEYFELAAPVPNQVEGNLLFLVDLKADNLPPLKYMMTRSRQYYAAHPGVSERLYIAFLHENYQIKMAQVLLDSMRSSTTRRFFNRSEYDDAIAWLMSKQPDAQSHYQR